MKGGLYVIYDRAAEEAGPVFDAVNQAVALRNYRNLMEKVPAYQRSDYRLYQVGMFDTHTMSMTAVEPALEIIYSEESDGK